MLSFLFDFAGCNIIILHLNLLNLVIFKLTQFLCTLPNVLMIRESYLSYLWVGSKDSISCTVTNRKYLLIKKKD